MRSPNPWTVAKRKVGKVSVLGIVDATGKPVMFDIETMHRIVACVNACDEIPTDELLDHANARTQEQTASTVWSDGGIA